VKVHENDVKLPFLKKGDSVAATGASIPVVYKTLVTKSEVAFSSFTINARLRMSSPLIGQVPSRRAMP
jgi:hypothetical protein